jgi:PAS domain S-box-containing protein
MPLRVLVLVAALSIAGYFVTSETIRRDRRASAQRRVQMESVRTQGVLVRARAYVVGLGNVLAEEVVPARQRFETLVRSTVGSVGLADAMWVQSVEGSERGSFERSLGGPITRVTPSGSFEPAAPQASYLVATDTTGTRPELRQGVDVSGWPALGTAIRNRASVFGVTASDRGSLGGQPGFYLLEAGNYGHGGASAGFLVVFVPPGWLTVSLEDDPRRMVISLGGQRHEGALSSAPAASASFDALARHWSIDVGREPASNLQSLLPWLALGWPIVVAFLVSVVAGGIVRRRRAEREAQRIFDLSLDLLGVAGLDGDFKRVNPAFERILGYSPEEILSRPLQDFVHPDDWEQTADGLDALARGEELLQFENRYIRRDGSVCWLQWSVRPIAGESLVYAAGRDITDQRHAEDELRVLAEEQAALRRVATLVARGAPPASVFDAVVAEVSQLLKANATGLFRHETDGAVTVVAARNETLMEMRVGERFRPEADGLEATVVQTGRPAGVDSHQRDISSTMAARMRELGIRSAVAAPIVVADHTWGVVIAVWAEQAMPTAEVQRRMAEFTELVGTAVSTAETRAELNASRARIVAAADETRRRIERDLHDGTQQRLLSLALALRAAEARVPPELDGLRAELSRTASGLTGAVDDLREVSRGIHPAILSHGGLGSALKTLARRAAVPVELDLNVPGRLPDQVEVAAYYVVTEALTNVAKHAHASVVHVELDTDDAGIQLAVRDDGVGGVDPERGSGLIGLRDRVEALGGTIEITGRPGSGTSIVVRIPLAGMVELGD